MSGMASPGWYPDPGGTGAQRYWNGREWTSDTRPADPSSYGHWSGPQRLHHREIVIGWITAVFFPPVGAIIGIRLLRTEERKHGIWMIVVAALVLTLIVLGSITDDSSARML
jgi:hypothetical protein